MLYPFILVILVSSVFFRPTVEPLAVISNVQRAKVPGNESSRERKFQGTNVPWNFRSWVGPGSESSRERKFHPMELSFPGVKVLWNESSCYRLPDTASPYGICIWNNGETRKLTLAGWTQLGQNYHCINIHVTLFSTSTFNRLFIYLFIYNEVRTKVHKKVKKVQ